MPTSHAKPRLHFRQILEQLEKHYGRPKSPRVIGPLEIILYENVSYLASDERREHAFAELKRRVGTHPKKILAASEKTLTEIARISSVMPGMSAGKIKRVAEIAHSLFHDDLRAVLKKPPAEAKKALKKFRGIGDPGAEKILLFTRTLPVLALESNGLRVLRRLAYGQELKSYSASYRSAQEALADQLPKECETLIRAHQLLRQHGKELCKRSNPLCNLCPLREGCPYFFSGAARGNADA